MDQSTAALKERLELYSKNLKEVTKDRPFDDVLFIIGRAMSLLSQVVENQHLGEESYFTDFVSTLESTLKECEQNEHKSKDEGITVEFYRRVFEAKRPVIKNVYQERKSPRHEERNRTPENNDNFDVRGSSSGFHSPAFSRVTKKLT